VPTATTTGPTATSTDDTGRHGPEPVAAPAAQRWRWIVPLAVAGAIWLAPHGGFSAQSWGLLCLFAFTIAALITRPLPAGSVMLVVMSAGTLLRIFTIQDALAGYSNVTVWLIVAAFMFARGFTRTRLGERIAYTIVRGIGASALRLGYAIVLAELVMSPFTPSNTARAGGVVFPIARNVARAFGSEPGPTAPLIGAFLMLTLYHGDLIVSAMFLTAVAPNPLVADFVRQASGVHVSWTRWAIAASVPGIVALAAVPYVILRLSPPAIADMRPAQALATERLRALGPVTRQERAMVAVFGVVLALWLAGEWLGVSATTVALAGVALMLLARVLEWRDLLDETGAWDALIWFGGLVMLTGQLDKAGFPRVFANGAAALMHGWPWWWALLALAIIYVYAHYAFASLVAHVTALFPPFFAAAIGFGAPPLVAAFALAVLSSVNGVLTHYGTGPAPIVFGAGYVSQGQWWRIGFLLSLVHLAIWLPIGFLWWKALGFW
jgi:divalent anion:Na+ symporter, DASS family